MNPPKTLLIVWHSMTGGTRQMAQALQAGALQEPGVQVRLLHASDAGADDLLAADGYVFATPENLAAMSGQLAANWGGDGGRIGPVRGDLFATHPVPSLASLLERVVPSTSRVATATTASKVEEAKANDAKANADAAADKQRETHCKRGKAETAALNEHKQNALPEI